eukprot:jgi/Orpsp1_1/1179782/evm.model.c7180000070734.1
MSEHPEIEFNYELMRKTLIDMSIKDAIVGLHSEDTPNRFINNGKLINFSTDGSVYSDESGLSFGNKVCSEGCCSKDGKCIRFNDANAAEKCLIENGCQSEFGYCTTSEKAIEECENELQEYDECLIKFSDYSKNKKNRNELQNSCDLYYSDKCKEYYKILYTGKTICSIAKNYKTFSYVDDFNFQKFNRFHEKCNEEYNKQCYAEYFECEVEKIYIKYNYKLFIDQCKSFVTDKCQEYYKNALNDDTVCSRIDTYL